MSIDEQPMNIYWSGKRTETSNNFKTNYKGSVVTKNNLPSSGNKTGDMYNITESGENFIWNGNFWDSLSGDTLKTLNWQKSEKASAVAIYPVSETILYPVVNFVFTETGPASGTKGPDNPSTITGVSNVTVTHCETTGVDSTDYAISLGSTYYGGSLDVATGVMTVTHFSSIINTLSSFVRARTNTVTFNLPLAQKYNGLLDNSFASNKFDCYRTSDDVEHISWRQDNNSPTAYLYIDKSHLDVSGAVDPTSPTDAEWLSAAVSWIQSNPVQVVACLSTPQIVTITPTQIYSLSQNDLYTPRINTVYSDQQSVQVGYPKSPIVTTSELTNAIVSLGGNI